MLPIIAYGSGAKLTKSTSIILRRPCLLHRLLTGRSKSSWEEEFSAVEKQGLALLFRKWKPGPVDAESSECSALTNVLTEKLVLARR